MVSRGRGCQPRGNTSHIPPPVDPQDHEQDELELPGNDTMDNTNVSETSTAAPKLRGRTPTKLRVSA